MKNLISKNGIAFYKLPVIQFTCTRSGCDAYFESDEYVVEGPEGQEIPVDNCPICGSIVKEDLKKNVESD